MTPLLLSRSPELAENTALVLEAAAVRIERDGFAQKAFFDVKTGRYCTRGAITQAGLDVLGSTGNGCWWVIDAAVMAMTMYVGTYLASWNDRPGRTQIEVVKALRKSAAEVRSMVVVAA